LNVGQGGLGGLRAPGRQSVAMDGADVSTGADRAYPGARPFERTDSGRFFGRTAEAAYLGQRWAENPLTYLSGPAGIGKTSLLAAGVLPLVEAANVSLLPVGDLSCGVRSPVAALSRHNPYTMALLRSWSAAGSVVDMAGVGVGDFISQHASRRDQNVSILAAIDQVDDLFAGSEASQASIRPFLEELAAALRAQPTLHLLIATREEALPWLTEILGPGVQFQLGTLEPQGALRAAMGAQNFESEAASELVRQIRTSRIVARNGEDRIVVSEEVEPALLQIACARLWKLLRAGPGAGSGSHSDPSADAASGSRLDAIAIDELDLSSDVDSALSGYCSDAIAAVATAHEIPVAWLRFWLIDTFITEVGERDSAPDDPAGTAGRPRAVARALEDRHLLRTQAEQPTSPRSYRLLSDRIMEPIRHALDRASGKEDPSLSLRAAERALMAGELRLAERYAMTVLENAPDTALHWHADARSLLGNLAYQQGNFDRAEEHYRAAAELSEAANDRDAVVRLLRAISRTLTDRGRFADAISQLSAALYRATVDAAAIASELDRVMAELTRHSPEDPRWDTSAG